MLKIYYRGYLLVRLKGVGNEGKVVEKLKGLEAIESDENWKITYATIIFGGWDLMVECVLTNIQELDKITSFCSVDEDLSQWIEEVTTLVSHEPDYTI